MNQIKFIITTGLKETYEQSILARNLSWQTGAPYVTRNGRSLAELQKEYQVGGILLVHTGGVLFVVDGMNLFFHPGMAKLRIKRLKTGKTDQMIKAMALKPGHTVLDCTLGLAADALVASFVTGAAGKVVGLESQLLLATVVKYGLTHYQGESPGLLTAMGRIQVECTDHRKYLARLPADSFDVVYFDPMFRYPRYKSNSMTPLRAVANTDRLSLETVYQAQRVAKRRVVIKDDTRSEDFQKLGCHRVIGGKHAPIAYGVLERGAIK